MKLAVAAACLALSAVHCVEGANQPGQWGQPAGQLPGGAAPPVNPWWQSFPSGAPASVQPLPGSASVAPVQQLPGAVQQLPGAGAPFRGFQGPPGFGASEFQQSQATPGAPSLQHFGGGASGVAPVQQLLGPAASAPALGKAPVAAAPVAFGLSAMHDQPELVQHRTRVTQGGPGPNASMQQPGGPLALVGASSGAWRESNTAKAVADLHAQVTRLFRRSAGDSTWAFGGSEVAVPIENLHNVLMEMSKLIPAVIMFCEAERMQKTAVLGGFQGFSPANGFPADQFIAQSAAFSRRVTAQLQALRDLLAAVLAPSSTKESVAAEIRRFKTATADLKEVYQLGSQVSNAAVGAVLPYVSSCSFFGKGDHEGTYQLWSLVGARVSSTLRYLIYVLSAMRSVSRKLTELVSGEIQPRSLLDFSRLRPLSRAASRLETAEARSASAVRYFNELAEAYRNHTTQQAAGGASEEPVNFGGDVTSTSASLPQVDENSGDDVEENAELSLLADEVPLDGAGSGNEQNEMQEALQTVQESPAWPPVDESGEEEQEEGLQTVEAD